jgi:hypothetical protein
VAVAGSVGVVGVGVLGLGVLSPAAGNAVAPMANLTLARDVVTMSGLPMLTMLPPWWLGHAGSGR